MKNLVFGMSIYFEKPTQQFVHLGRECYEQGLVPWDKECLLASPATNNEHSHIHYIGNSHQHHGG